MHLVFFYCLYDCLFSYLIIIFLCHYLISLLNLSLTLIEFLSLTFKWDLDLSVTQVLYTVCIWNNDRDMVQYIVIYYNNNDDNLLEIWSKSTA